MLSKEQTFHPQEVAFVKKLAELVIAYQDILQTESPLKLQQALGGFPRNSTPIELVQLQSAVAALKGKVPGKHEDRKAKRLLQKYAPYGMVLCETNTAGFSIQLTAQAKEEVKSGIFLVNVKLNPFRGPQCRGSSSSSKTSKSKKARTSRENFCRPRRPETERVLASLCHASVKGSTLGISSVVFLAPGEFVNTNVGARPLTIPSIGDDFEMIDIERC